MSDNEPIVFPNPSNGTFSYVFIAAKMGTTDVEIVDLHGKVVWQKDIEVTEGKNRIEVTEFSGGRRGIFFIRERYGKVLFTKKILVL